MGSDCVSVLPAALTLSGWKLGLVTISLTLDTMPGRRRIVALECRDDASRGSASNRERERLGTTTSSEERIAAVVALNEAHGDRDVKVPLMPSLRWDGELASTDSGASVLSLCEKLSVVTVVVLGVVARVSPALSRPPGGATAGGVATVVSRGISVPFRDFVLE